MFTPNATTLPKQILTTTTTTEATTTTTVPTGGDDGSSGLSDDDNNDNSNDNDTTTYSLPGSVRKSIIPKMSYTSLRISRISYSTHGIFRCVATSFAGRVTKEFHITVLGGLQKHKF